MKPISGFINSERYKSLDDLQKGSVELCLTYCGSEECDAGHRYGPNKRISHVLHIITNGKGRFEVDNKVYHLEQGDAFIIFPGMECWYEADKKEPWSYCWIGFTGMKTNECLANCGFTMENLVQKLLHPEIINTYINQMLEAHMITYADELKRNGLLRLLFAQMIKDYSGQVPGHSKEDSHSGTVYVKKAMIYIEENYDKKIRIDEMANFIGVNRSYLTSTFKKATGYSLQEYLINLRMEKAKNLLKKTDLPINTVSNAVGYADQLAFSRMFKQHYGLSPRNYRETGGEEQKVYKEKGDYTDAIL